MLHAKIICTEKSYFTWRDALLNGDVGYGSNQTVITKRSHEPTSWTKSPQIPLSSNSRNEFFNKVEWKD